VLVRAASSNVAEEAELRERALEAIVNEHLHIGIATEELLAAIAEKTRKQIEQRQESLAEKVREHSEAIERWQQGLADKLRTMNESVEMALSEMQQQMMAKIVMNETEPLSEELLQGALEELRHRRLLSQREGEIKRGIVEAERRNDVAALLRLKQEKLELDRKLAGI